MEAKPQSTNSYDPRLKDLVRQTGDIQLAMDKGVPRSTAYRWLREVRVNVVSFDELSGANEALQQKVLKLQKQNQILKALLRFLIVAIRVAGFSFAHLRVPDVKKNLKLIETIESSKKHIPINKLLGMLKISSARYYAWKRLEAGCDLEDQSSCPNSNPNRLTTEEILEIKDMVTSDEFRHVSTGTLSVLAQRLGRVFASSSTWYRLVRERGWRRPRLRIHPEKPRGGIRAKKPNEIWHIDTTIIKLLDGSRVYLHAVIDNFSRKILGWKVSSSFEKMNTVEVLLQAIKVSSSCSGYQQPKVMMDGGVENFNSKVDELIESGLLKRVLAQTEISFSNSMIESWWRVLKHQWLYLNSLDSLSKVEKLISFYVNQHNEHLPHSAFNGQTPDEMYLGTGVNVSKELKKQRALARQRRLDKNRLLSCSVCEE